MAFKKVIDVSEFNGMIDWQAAAGQIDGAIIRIGYRGYGGVGTLMRDKQSERNLSAVIAHGIPWGAYFLTQATSEAEAQAEAEFVYGALAGKTAPLGVWLDSELGEAHADGRADRMDRAKRTECAMAFLIYLTKKGQMTGLYCADSWFRDMLYGEAIRAAGHKIWLASVEEVQPKSTWDGWQYTWKGAINGIKTAVDISRFKEESMDNRCFEDTREHWAREEIRRMKERGLIKGKTEDMFCPDDPITRAEVSVIIDRLCQKLGI